MSDAVVVLPETVALGSEKQEFKMFGLLEMAHWIVPA